MRMKLLISVFVFVFLISLVHADTLISDGFTVSLLHFNEGSNAVNFIDVATGNTSAKHWNGTNGANASVVQKKFGTSSLFCEGVNDFVITDEKNIADFSYGTNQNYTIDFWFYPTTLADGDMFQYGVDSSVGNIRITTKSTGAYRILTAQPSAWTVDYVSSALISAGQWQHIAIERNSNNLTFYHNGNPFYSVANSAAGYSDANAQARFCTPTGGAAFFGGYIDEFRYSTVGRYGGRAFTPQSQEYGGSPLSGTVTLLYPSSGMNFTSIVRAEISATGTNGNISNVTMYASNGAVYTNFTSLSGATNGTNRSLTLSDGLYNVSYKVEFTNGTNTFINRTNNVTVRVDSTAPSVSIIFPSNGQTYTNNITTINYSISDSGVGLSSCWLMNESGSNKSISCTSGVEYINRSDGTGNLKIYANDTINNIGSAQTIFTIDTVPKGLTVDLLSPANNNVSSNNSQNLKIQLTPISVNVTNVTFTIWNSTNSIIQYYVNNSYTLNVSVNMTHLFTDLPDNALKWNAYACYVNLSNSNVCNFAINNNTLTIDTIKPAIGILYPTASNYNYVVSALNFTLIDANIQSCWYSTNSGTTNTTVTCGSNVTGLTASQGLNTWIVWANDTINNVNSSSVTFNVDSIAPLLSYNGFSDANASTLTRNYINAGIIVSDPNLDSFSISLYNGTLNLINKTLGTRNITFYSLPDGNYYYNATANDTYGNVNSTQTRQVTIDTTSPVLTIYSPLGNVSTLTTPYSVVLNATATDLRLAQCWYKTSENLTNTYYACSSLQTISFATGGQKTIQAFANDTYGNVGNANISFSAFLFNITQSVAQNPITEGMENIVTLIVNLPDYALPTTTAELTWNGVDYGQGTTTSIDANTKRFTHSFVIPDGAGNLTGIPVYWNWTFTVAGFYSSTQTALQTQTIKSVEIDDCTNYNHTIINMTLKDEGLNTVLNVSNLSTSKIGIDLIIKSIVDPTIQWQYSKEWNNNESVQVCVPSTLLDTSNYTIDIVAGYDATSHVQEFYYLENGTLSNTQYFNSYTNSSINLMDLASTDSTTFLFTFTDSDGLLVNDGIVHVLRKYIGDGIYREVERGKLDNNGATHLHLVEEDVIYIFEVSRSGQIIYTSTSYNAKCLSSPCSITLSAETENEPFPTVYDNLPDGSYRISADSSTRDVTLYFNLNQTDTMNLTIYTADNNVARVVASGTTTASAGEVVVNVPTQYGNSTYYAVIYKGSEFVATKVISLAEDANDYFGALGLLLGALAVLCLAMIGASQGEWVVVWTVLGVVLVSAMYLVDLPWYALMTFVAGAGVFLIKLVARRRNG